MGSVGTEHVYDLKDIKENKKTFKDVIDMKTAKKPELITVQNDISGQVVYSEKGANVVVTAYDTQEVKYQKVEIVKTKETAETKGKNKGKFACVIKTYNAIVEDGKVTGYAEEPVSTSKTKYYKDADIVTTYNTLNSKNKVIATTIESVVGADEIIVNKAKVLGTVTCKNGESSVYDLYADSADFDGNLFTTHWYAPQKSGKKYTGTWLQEDATSTSANETFNLGVNRDDLYPDDINYDMELAGGHGKDTVVLAKGSRVNIVLENDVDIVRTFSKNKNNVTLTMGKTPDYNSSGYTKHEIVVIKSGGKYWAVDKNYEWSKETEQFELTSTSNEYELTSEVRKSLEHSIPGLKLVVGINTYFQDSEYHFYTNAEEPLAKVTFNNYLKLAEDGVTVGETSLKELLESAQGVGILGDSEATKKQKLTGTFLNETFNGGKGKDTISTGTGTDTVNTGGGNDTITLAGGNKILNFASGDGNDTVKGVENADKVTISLGENVRSSWFTKSGNDLVINRLYGGYQLGGNADEVPETVTISNYFKKENYDKSKIELSYKIEGNLQKIEDLTAAFKEYEGEVILFDNAQTKAKSITGSDLSDYIIAGRKTTKINAGEGNNEIIFAPDGKSSVTAKAGSGDDCYTVSNMGVSHDIYDAGGNDYLHLDSGEFVADYYGLEPTEWQAQYTPDDFVFIFDVLAEGQTATKKNDLTSLHVVYSQNYESYNTTMAERLTKYGAKGLLNTVNIHDYFKSDGTIGTGTIETIILNGESEYYYSFSDFDKVRTDVVDWLAEHNQYSSAMDVIQSKNADDITSLLNVYASVTPQEPC